MIINTLQAHVENDGVPLIVKPKSQVQVQMQVPMSPKSQKYQFQVQRTWGDSIILWDTKKRDIVLSTMIEMNIMKKPDAQIASIIVGVLDMSS